MAGGVVSYSNEAKIVLLGVDPELIERHGAVSEPVAEAMADGALERFDADLGVGITGIAGPGGGSEEKPVGYVCVCVKSRDGRMIARDSGDPRRAGRYPRALGVAGDAPVAPAPAGRGLPALTVDDPQPYEVAVPEETLEDLRTRLRATRWERRAGPGWEYGMDQAYLRELCAYWASSYDWRALERRLNALANFRHEGIHFIYEPSETATGKLPIVLLHGWPGGPIEFLDLIPMLTEAGHDVIVPSLPGYGFSEPPATPLNVAGIASALIGLLREGLGLDRVIVQGGDWGGIIGARIAFDDPDLVAGLHSNAAFTLPIPAELSDPPLSEAEQAYAQEGMRSTRRGGYHLVPQGRAPDAMAPGMLDSPAGLAAWLVEKYRNWSDCDGEIERRFTKQRTCDLLTMYWVTGTIGSSMRLYAAEARDRWRFAEGERIGVPAAVADFPVEILRPPREWVERTLTDLRSWTEMPRGGHFAAIEEPRLLADDILRFASGL